jgi:glutaredoxin
MIKIYTQTICPKCIVAKSLFKENDIEFELINLDNDQESKQKLVDLGFMATPIVEHDGKFYTNMAQFQQLVDDLE